MINKELKKMKLQMLLLIFIVFTGSAKGFLNFPVNGLYFMGKKTWQLWKCFLTKIVTSKVLKHVVLIEKIHYQPFGYLISMALRRKLESNTLIHRFICENLTHRWKSWKRFDEKCGSGWRMSSIMQWRR